MLEAKVKSLRRLAKEVSRLRRQGKKVVFTNGCFDLLHYGHLKYLESARSAGDILVVGVNSDASVKRLKGPKRPIVGQKYRVRLIAGLECVDYAVVFGQDTPLEVIKTVKPDILVKGADWKRSQIVGGDFVAKNGGKVLTIKFEKGLSTTSLINKIVQSLQG
ncbi:MAG: D-glycero-beta-D-manno-heptose 1-phosphate adenylyltransferase [Candidatus Omnitrophica bacterium]|jgi:D-beta-D-heptose 7-phosphate kinase/D-beta-D-heptose 1-phosphate adenosyltransferase|nr:D-glycero-beta-D-manno-heptose 1-phosphate adenylyltransferase [Candidatus Omnitrophota bacterium]MDD5078967.1 D-glycero-beta-D-manno-heptose 1-phosphate adenylyltransferase [Candidatus Omnitrophota bacterium]